MAFDSVEDDAPASVAELNAQIAEAEARLSALHRDREDLLARLQELRGMRAAANTEPEGVSLTGATVTKHSSTDEKLALFRRLFRGREDVYPRRWESLKSRRSGYQPPLSTVSSGSPLSRIQSFTEHRRCVFPPSTSHGLSRAPRTTPGTSHCLAAAWMKRSSFCALSGSASTSQTSGSALCRSSSSSRATSGQTKRKRSAPCSHMRPACLPLPPRSARPWWQRV